MRVVLLQTAIGDYRQSVLEILADQLGRNFEVYAGLEYFDPSTQTRISLPHNLSIVSNHFMLGRRLLVQTGALRKVLSADVAILELNPRILTVWMLLLARRLLKRKTILWGHAWSRIGRLSKTEPVRNIMRTLADTILLYTESQKAELQEVMPKKRLISAPNALYRAQDMTVAQSEENPRSFIYVGRLVATKKPGLLLDAFGAVLDQLPDNSRLLIVGDGPLRADLEGRSIRGKLKDRVVFFGHVADMTTLLDLYGRSLFSVSPGYVGLSITQSFAFGVPMIIADHEPHSPEIEAARRDENCVFFQAGSAHSLGEAMLQVSAHADDWEKARQAIVDDCRKRYSSDLMASRIIEAVRD